MKTRSSSAAGCNSGHRRGRDDTVATGADDNIEGTARLDNMSSRTVTPTKTKTTPSTPAGRSGRDGTNGGPRRASGTAPRGAGTDQHFQQQPQRRGRLSRRRRRNVRSPDDDAEVVDEGPIASGAVQAAQRAAATRNARAFQKVVKRRNKRLNRSSTATSRQATRCRRTKGRRHHRQRRDEAATHTTGQYRPRRRPGRRQEPQRPATHPRRRKRWTASSPSTSLCVSSRASPAKNAATRRKNDRYGPDAVTSETEDRLENR